MGPATRGFPAAAAAPKDDGGGRYYPPKPTSAQRFPPTGAFTRYGQRGKPPPPVGGWGFTAFPKWFIPEHWGCRWWGIAVNAATPGETSRRAALGPNGDPFPKGSPALTGTSPGPLSLATTGGISLDLFTSPY